MTGRETNRRTPILVGLVIGLFFVILELLKTVRSSQWALVEGTDWAGLAVATGIYMFIGTVVAAAARRLIFSRLGNDLSAACVLITSGVLIWTTLSYFREERPTLDDVLVLGALSALGLAIALGRRVLRLDPAAVLATAAFVFLVGIDTVVDTAFDHLFDEDRARRVLMKTVVAMGVSATAALIFLLATRSREVLRRAAYFLAFAVVLLLFLGDRRGASSTTQPNTRATPNLVFVVSDTLRADYLQRHGGTVETPHLDALADGGTDFERAYSLAPWTFPSMWGLMASQYPKGLSSDGDDTWLEQIWRYVEDPGGVTLTEQLKAKGYRTAAMSGNALLWGMPLATRGFDTLATAHPILLTREGPLRALPFLYDALSAVAPSWIFPRPHNTTLDLAQYADAWLARNADAPFFLYVHYIDPHAPYDPPERYRSLTGPWPFFHPYSGGERWGIPQLVGDFAVAEEDRDYVRDLYRGEIQYVDKFLGRLMATLDHLDVRENTVIAFTSDHGEELWDHGGWGHGQSLYEELLHVPLIFNGPGVQAQRRREPVSAIDFTPTLAGLMGIEADVSWQGTSHADALRDPDVPIPDAPIFAQGTSNKSWPHPQQSVIAGRYKLIRHAGSDTLELYNLEVDPKELDDLSQREPERVATLLNTLETWLASFDSTFDNVPANGLSGEAVQQLEGMGYL